MVMRNSTEKPCPSRKDVVLSSYVCTGHNLLLLGKVWKKSVSGLDWRDLGKAGTDTAIFKAYSVRGAAATAAHNAGVTTGDIPNAADWSTQIVFQKFYYKPSGNTEFGIGVLNQPQEGKATNTH